MALTKKQKEKYLKGEGGHCPYCGSGDIEGASWDYEGGYVYQDVTCLICEKAWQDSYTLTDVEEI